MDCLVTKRLTNYQIEVIKFVKLNYLYLLDKIIIFLKLIWFRTGSGVGNGDPTRSVISDQIPGVRVVRVAGSRVVVFRLCRVAGSVGSVGRVVRVLLTPNQKTR